MAFDTLTQGYKADVILLGAGSRRERRLGIGADGTDGWGKKSVLAIDIDRRCAPDLVFDLNNTPWPIESDCADEIHAYEVLEHLGRQGDHRTFFAHFYECWRILKPGGHLFATCPSWDSMWAWGDPGHSRVINAGSLVFLDQSEYTAQIGNTPMADYRHEWRGDFQRLVTQTVGKTGEETFMFVLQAVKPARV